MDRAEDDRRDDEGGENADGNEGDRGSEDRGSQDRGSQDRAARNGSSGNRGASGRDSEGYRSDERRADAERSARRGDEAARAESPSRSRPRLRASGSEEHGRSRRRLHRLAAALDKAGLRFSLDEELQCIQLAFQSEHYLDREGRKSIGMFLSVADGGDLILVEVPFAYRLSEARSRGAARKAILYANFSLKSIQFGIDPDDEDEVRARIELWQIGIDLTPEYIHSHLDRLACQLDYCDRMLRPVWKHGRSELRKVVARKMRPRERRKGSTEDMSGNGRARSGDAGRSKDGGEVDEQ
jgi:hypothetical protein